MTQADRRIMAIATGQLGTFTRAQATDAGLSDRQLRSRVTSGFLSKTGPNSFRITGAPVTPECELRALMLDVGGEVWATGPTAAALLGFTGFRLRRPFHLMLRADRNVRRTGVVIRRTERLEIIDRAEVEGVPVTSGVRTVLELARTASPEQLDDALENLFLLGLTNEDLLMRRIAALRSKGRYGIPALLDAVDRRTMVGRTESWLEREYLTLLRSAGLPAPLTQQTVARSGDRLVRVDCRFAGTNVVVELLGYRYHRSRSEMTRDAARLNAIIASGLSPYQFTFDQVVGEPQHVVETTRTALQRALPTA